MEDIKKRRFHLAFINSIFSFSYDDVIEKPSQTQIQKIIYAGNKTNQSSGSLFENDASLVGLQNHVWTWEINEYCNKLATTTIIEANET